MSATWTHRGYVSRGTNGRWGWMVLSRSETQELSALGSARTRRGAERRCRATLRTAHRRFVEMPPAANALFVFEVTL